MEETLCRGHAILSCHQEAADLPKILGGKKKKILRRIDALLK